MAECDEVLAAASLAGRRTVFASHLQARTLRRALALLMLLVGFAGIALRFNGLSTRVFWADEVITSVRLAGYTVAEYTHEFYDGRVHTAAQLRRYMTADASGRGVGGVVRSLRLEDEQHPPLYYILTYYWARAFGSTPGALRMTSAIFGALVPFGLAWLCWELFADTLAAALAFALGGVSPVLVIYSQQAREYALWSLLAAVSTAILLRASRNGKAVWWAAYAVCAIAGLYTDFIFLLLLVGHAAYAAVLLRGRKLRDCSIAIAAAGIAFAPWALVVAEGMHRIDATNAWSAQPWPLVMVIEKWVFNTGATFFDLEYARAGDALVLVPIIALAAYGLYRVLRAGTMKQRLIAAALIVPSVIFIALPDLLMHEHRSTVTRYGMQFYLGLIVVVAGLLARGIRARSKSRWGWSAAALALVAVSLFSAYVDVHASVWWDNHEDGNNPQMASIVADAQNPLLIARNDSVKLLELGVYLPDSVHIEPLAAGAPLQVAPGYPSVFLYGREPDARLFRRFLGPNAVHPAFSAVEGNAQLRQFRSKDPRDGARDLLSLWRLGPSH